MYSQAYHHIRDVNSGSYNWKLKVRIIRLWRGVSKTGDQFKGLNVLLLDAKNDRIHAFVPGNIINKHDENFVEGNICTIANFSVKDYKSDEKFRCVNSEKQIVFTTYTEVYTVVNDDKLIPKNMFDFYDLSDLFDIANQNIYLTDVIGVIEKDLPLSNLVNRLGHPQTQMKFTIVDGRCSTNVTFWDSLAEEFEIAKSQINEFPAIVIIASAKVTSWQGTNQSTPQIELSNATATKFYLNYDHHNVHHLRKMLETPLFSKYDFSSQIPQIIQSLSIAEIKNLGIEYLQKEVICQGQIKTVLQNSKWYTYECSSCYKEIEPNDGIMKCYRCSDRNVPHPYKKWHIYIKLQDDSGCIDVVLLDREVRNLLGVNVEDFENVNNGDCPDVIRNLKKKYVTVKLEIKRANVENEDSSFYASDIYDNTLFEKRVNMEDIGTSDPMQESMTQASGSSIHLDQFSQLNFQSPEVRKQKRKVLKKKSN